jgi:hypothetical protein
VIAADRAAIAKLGPGPFTKQATHGVRKRI